MHPIAVTFDFGQTLADLDAEFLSQRLRERGLDLPAQRLDAAVPAAQLAYNRAILAGEGGHPWQRLMRELLREAGAPASAAEPTAAWLWDEQPKRNLWRRPVPGMIELVRELRQRGVPVGVISNSEGRLAELAAELGWRELLEPIADSGALGMEKPEPAIFDWTARRLGVSCSALIQVGDSFAADVEGALRAGGRAIWFRGAQGQEPRPVDWGRVRTASDAAGVRAGLRAFGVGV